MEVRRWSVEGGRGREGGGVVGGGGGGRGEGRGGGEREGQPGKKIIATT